MLAESPDPGETRTLRLTHITVEPALSLRQYTDFAVIEDYANCYADDPALLPPLDVFQVAAGQYVLADGFHRYRAAEEAGLDALPCRVFAGTRRDAMLHAVDVNGRQHGLAYSHGDHANIVRWFLADAELAELSHREIARRIGCSHTHVNTVARAVQAEATIAQALETVSTTAKSPQGQQREQLAGLLNVPARDIRPASVPFYRRRLQGEVTDGKTLDEAISAVRVGFLGSSPSPSPPPPPAPRKEEVPPPPPPRSPQAMALGAAFADTLARSVGLDLASPPGLPTHEELVKSLTAMLIAEPAFLEEASITASATLCFSRWTERRGCHLHRF
jgi:ParB-like chromosome segregation protein Spo0J